MPPTIIVYGFSSIQILLVQFISHCDCVHILQIYNIFHSQKINGTLRSQFSSLHCFYICLVFKRGVSTNAVRYIHYAQRK